MVLLTHLFRLIQPFPELSKFAESGTRSKADDIRKSLRNLDAFTKILTHHRDKDSLQLQVENVRRRSQGPGIFKQAYRRCSGKHSNSSHPMSRSTTRRLLFKTSLTKLIPTLLTKINPSSSCRGIATPNAKSTSNNPTVWRSSIDMYEGG